MTPSNRSSAARAGAPEQDQALADEVLRGLRQRPKTLPAKLFYDQAGAALFEQICVQPEYYLTRTEIGILRERADEIAALVGPRAALIEFGSGAGVKVRTLLDALEAPSAYVPIDVSREQLAAVSARIAAEYPRLSVRPVCGDYLGHIELPPLPDDAPRVAFFPGSTIGNLHPMEAAAFLRRVRRLVGRGGRLILGVDSRKNPDALHAAYNDSAGVTAQFNLNILRHINRELDADFDLARFAHRAFFNADASRVEMHLESLGRQCVHVAGMTVTFENGECIWTESSYKYDRDRLHALVADAGFQIERLWTDSDNRFWVAVLVA